MPQGNHKQALYVCPYCGARFSPQTAGGVCPYCHRSNQQLIERQRRQYRRMQQRKKMMKRAVFRLCLMAAVLALLIVAAFSLITHILKGNESLVFSTERQTTSPVFFTDSDGLLYHYAYAKGGGTLIGRGEIRQFVYSPKNKTTYAVFYGSRDTESLTAGALLLRISDSGKIETIQESPYGTITFVQGGNCAYLYFLVNEELGSYQNSARLYIYDASTKNVKRISEYEKGGYYENFRVSANGRYLLYKAENGDGTKLMRYSVKTGTPEALGIKNAEPVSIDNKGQYYSYLRINEEGLSDFYLESGVSNREKTPLDKAYVDRILVSNDARSFVIETGNVTVIKSAGSEPCEIAARTGSGIGLDIFSNRSVVDNSEQTYSFVHALEQCANSSFLPYYYLVPQENGTQTLMYCDKNGVKDELLSNSFTDFCTNGTLAAYIADASLYTARIDLKNTSEKLVSENFADYHLDRMSENGKYMFYSDADGNYYRIPFRYTGADWIKSAVDADPYLCASDGRSGIYLSDGALYSSKDDEQEKISDLVVPTACYVMNDGARTVFLAQSEDSKAENAYTLYLFDGKKVTAVQNNVTSITGEPTFAALYTGAVPYSSYVAPIPPQGDDTASDGDTGTVSDTGGEPQDAAA